MLRKAMLLTSLVVSLVMLSMATIGHAYEAINGPTGVLKYNKEKAYNGYTLFSPIMNSKTTYLINMEGDIVHTWKSDYPPGLYAELLPNGHLLRAGRVPQKKEEGYCTLRGAGGIIQELDWNGNVVWEYDCFKKGKFIQHHTWHRKENGNTLILMWEYITRKEALKLGRLPENIPAKAVVDDDIPYNGFWMDYVIEVTPAKKIVWEWHLIDHLGKGYNKIDFNYILPTTVSPIEASFDWSHFNTVDFMPETNQVLLNSRNLSELYLIDYKTGEITKRWGNDTTWNPKAKMPSFYNDGAQIMFGEHNANPLKTGNIIVFDDGSERPEARRSRALEMDPRTGKIVWQFASRHTNSFSSHRQGGVERLPNGNTIICSSHGGHVIEVTSDKEVVWEFVSPIVAGETKCIVGNKDAVTSIEDSMKNVIHRALRYGPDYPGLKGRDLSSKGYICGGDCPRFYRDYAGGNMGDDEGEEQPTMKAY